MRKVVIVSLRFNPAFIQFLIAYAKAVRELGYQAAFLLDPTYRRFAEVESAAPIFGVESAYGQQWTHAVFLNPAIQNRDIAAALKREGAKVLYIFHEPWDMSLGYLRSEGVASTMKAILAHRATIPVLKLADTVILASRYGMKVYEKGDARFNGNCVHIPLIMEDEAPENIVRDLTMKRNFGFCGALCRSHGFDQYVSFMRDVFRRRADVRFLVASRDPFPPSIMRDPSFSQNRDRIEIRCGRPLSNEEMNLCYAECFCIWNLYRRSTQSAVLPKAFMFGTPVIASQIGSFPEYVEEGVNGRFAEANNLDGILGALEEVRSHLGAYAVNCRQTFLKEFFYGSRLADIRRLLL